MLCHEYFLISVHMNSVSPLVDFHPAQAIRVKWSHKYGLNFFTFISLVTGPKNKLTAELSQSAAYHWKTAVQHNIWDDEEWSGRVKGILKCVKGRIHI